MVKHILAASPSAVVLSFDDQATLSLFEKHPDDFIAAQLTKRGLEFNFWRDKKKNEMDFIIDLGNGKAVALESKSYVKTKREPSIKAFQRSYPRIPVLISYQETGDEVKKDDGRCPGYLI